MFEILSKREENKILLRERASRLAELYKTKTLREIAAGEGLTRERVRQILKVVGVSGKDGWRRKFTLSRTAALEAGIIQERDERCLSLYGCDWQTYVALTGQGRLYSKTTTKGRGILSKYWMHRYNAEKQCNQWNFTLAEYCELVAPHLPRMGRGNFVLGRKDKNGPFSKDNCEVIHLRENSRNTMLQAYAEKTSQQERDIARMRAAGLSFAQIAKVAGLAENTVKTYLYRLSNKARAV